MNFRFDITKAIEATSRFLELSGGELGVGQLGKRIYLADRRSLKLYRYPIVGDTYASMKNGPMVSTVYDLTKDPAKRKDWVSEESWQQRWDRHFSRERFVVKLREAVEPSALSRADLEIIEEVNGWIRPYDPPEKFPELSEKLHRLLPEWRDPGESRIIITVEALLDALKMTAAEKEDVLEQSRFQSRG
jgi:hypothetical protein